MHECRISVHPEKCNHHGGSYDLCLGCEGKISQGSSLSTGLSKIKRSSLG